MVPAAAGRGQGGVNNRMDIKQSLFIRAHILHGQGRHSDADLMIRASNAIEMLERGVCPYCGNPLPPADFRKKEGEK